MLTRPDLSKLSVAETDALIVRLFDELDAMSLLVQKLQARVEELEARSHKDSHNSHKPPSSDGYGMKKPKSLRERSGRKPGGQQGHEGSTRRWVSNPAAVEPHRLPSPCDACAKKLNSAEQTVIRLQVFDLVKPVLQVTERRGYETHCSCGKHHISSFPPEAAAPVQYGSVVKGMLVYLTQQQLLPLARQNQVRMVYLG
jgi:transposase